MHTDRFYPGIADALRFSSSVLFIVTTKQVKVGNSTRVLPHIADANLGTLGLFVVQARFAEALLKDLAALDFPETHIFGLGTG